MKYMVFIIYIIVMWQWINSTYIAKRVGIQRGYNYYKTRGIINTIIGFAGMFMVNIFLRDKDIIPPFFVWSALIGFFLLVLYGMFCIYKMMVSTEP